MHRVRYYTIICICDPLFTGILVKTIVVIDYGLGNLKSVRRAFERAGARVVVSKSLADIRGADGLVLPGVGAFHDGMARLGALRDVLFEAVDDGKMLLGICLGMQMFLGESEEGGGRAGLGLIPGRVVRFAVDGLKIPHMGWNSISFDRGLRFFRGVPDRSYVYFVHSYYVEVGSEFVVATCEYGVDFAAVVVNRSGNVIGTQFHPEKSGDVGLRMIRNFLEMV